MKINFEVEKVEKYKDFSVTYYLDGTVFINNNFNNEKYFVRNKDDVVINENGYLFHYDNAANVISTKKLEVSSTSIVSPGRIYPDTRPV